MPKNQHHGLDFLLELHGEVMVLENGWWQKIEAWRVDPCEHRPHGIRYCLTLHNENNHRIIGFDNAHSPEQEKGGFSGRIVEYDHVHLTPKDKGTPYKFESPYQLIHDFYDHVDRILKEREGDS